MMISQLKSLVEEETLFQEAFTHSSVSKDANFERLEFLGDALIGAFITEQLYKRYPNKEGDLSRWKSAIVSQETMFKISQEHSLPDFLKTKNEKLKENKRIKASLVESYLGAIYIQQGVEAFREEATHFFKEYIDRAEHIFSEQDPKTILQEKAQQKFKITPEYEIIEKKIEGINSFFRVKVNLKNKMNAFGEGKSIKNAEKNAARNILEQWSI